MPARYSSMDRLSPQDAFIQEEADLDLETYPLNVPEAEAEADDKLATRDYQVLQHNRTGEGGSKGYHLPSCTRSRTISTVLVVTALVACATLAIFNTPGKKPPTGYRIGSHPAFVSYAALPVDRALAGYPQLCAAEIVAETCAKLNGGDASDSVKVSMLTEALTASKPAVKNFTSRIGISTFLFDTWFEHLNCMELCEKTVASFPPETLPTTSRTACVPVAGAAPVCDQALGSAERKVIAAETDPERQKNFENYIMSTTLSPAAKVAMSTTPRPLPSTNVGTLESQVLQLFHISPLLTINSNAAPTNVRKMTTSTDASTTATKIASDLNVVLDVVAGAVGKIQAWDEDTQEKFIIWFGVGDQATKDEVLRVLNGVLAKIYDPSTGIFWEVKPSCANENAFAYTFAPPVLNEAGQAIVVICPLYVSQEELTQLETIFHEITHLQPMDTEDYAYGYSKCQKLGTACKNGDAVSCSEALDNADTFTYFIFDVMNYYTGANSIANRLQLTYQRYKDKVKEKYASAKAKAKEIAAGSSA